MRPTLSLVLTTYHRFDTFLKTNLYRYLKNPYIDEIIVYDDHSPDYEKTRAEFQSHEKIKVFQQPKNVGVLRNKLAAISEATCTWICLMDSDNFCDTEYFKQLHSYWKSHGANPTTIYLPEKATPNFNFKSNTIPVTRQTWNQLHTKYDVMLNTGNYVFHRELVPIVLPIRDDVYIKGYTEVKYMNFIWVKDGNATLQMVPRMHYHHVVHPQSLWLATATESMAFNATFDWTIRSPSPQPALEA